MQAQLRRAALVVTLSAVLAGISGAPGAGAAAPAGAKSGAAAMKALVRSWSERLNANDNQGIAELFSLPATLIQGPYVYRLVTRSQIAEWHSGLPCAGKILSITLKGRYATAVFRLANRGSTPCDQPGTLAAARFGIVGGKIVSWQQVDVPGKAKSGGGTVA